MPVNIVIYDGKLLIDLSGDTVTPDKLLAGEIAHDKTGAQIIGTAEFGSSGVSTVPIESYTYDQRREEAANFLDNVTYDPSDYTVSKIENYYDGSGYGKNFPVGQAITVIPAGEVEQGDPCRGTLFKRTESGTTTLYNAVPGQYSPVSVIRSNQIVQTCLLHPIGALRMLYIPGTFNARDLGGWDCDGGIVKYGLLIRGGRLMESSKDVCLNQLGIKCDLDLRGTAEAGITESPLGGSVDFVCATNYNWYAITDKATWKQNLECVFDHVIKNEPVYFHCTAGADRTGTLACVLEALLGISQSDIDKDYELTTFYSGIDTDNNARRRNESEWVGLITAINNYDGDTIRDKAFRFVATCGIPISKINAFRAAMSTGTPETLHWLQPITSTLIGCTSSNSDVNAEYGEAYIATIAVENGYDLDSIIVTMGGVEITETAVSGNTIYIPSVTGELEIAAAASVPAVTYIVTNNLTHCNSSNSATSISHGKAYTATIMPDSNYQPGTITVTMGGDDISSAVVSGSTITIPNVTGDIVITCAANVTNIIDTVGISANTRISSSSGENRTLAGYAAVGANMDAQSLIHLTGGDVLRMKGVSIPDANDNYCVVAIYDSSAALVTTSYLHNGMTWNSMAFNFADGLLTVTCSAEFYIRMSVICADADAVVATINQDVT